MLIAPFVSVLCLNNTNQLSINFDAKILKILELIVITLMIMCANKLITA